MRNKLLPMLWLTLLLIASGCASTGRDASRPAVCPVLPPPPPSLMQPPSYEQRARRELFEPPQRPTPKCADCNE